MLRKRWTERCRPAAAALCVGMAILLAAGCGTDDAGGLSAAVVESNNRGVGLMGSFKYGEAEKAFAETLQLAPEWDDARVNLAIATLNQERDAEALAILEEVLLEAPDNLRARYLSGVLRFYRGESEQALESFRAVAAADEKDAYAAYFVAQNLAQLERLQEAMQWYEKAIALDPYLRSAYYGAAQTLRRLGRKDASRQMIEAYERFKDNPRARLVEIKYTRMGPKAEALAIDEPAPQRPAVPAGPLFLPPVLLGHDAFPADARLTTVDLDHDGRQDLFVTGGNADSSAVVLIGNPQGGFTRAAGHPLQTAHGVNAALWGDFDNDGLTDVFLCGESTSAIWRQTERNQWQQWPNALDDEDTACIDGAVFDADHDGDLDIFSVSASGNDELWNNDRDGSFRRLAADQGLRSAGASRGVVVADFDGDRDTDILVVKQSPPHRLFINDRMWRYTAASEPAAMLSQPLLGATAADTDSDGKVEFFGVAADIGVLGWHRTEFDAWESFSVDKTAPAATAAIGVYDFNGDGKLELLYDDGAHFQILTEADSGWTNLHRGVASGVIAVIDEAHGSSHAGYGVAGFGDGELIWWEPGSGRHAFVVLELSGRENAADAMRSNASGIGARLALRNGSHWTIAFTLDGWSAPGQSLQPVALGLNGTATADFVAIDWSDGVYQTELGLGAGHHTVTETQRQLSSCPVLFAWDGEKYTFVSDVLGVGGLGFLLSPGNYATPRPWEFFLLPPGLPVERDGAIALKITEPMEENAYLDALQLHVHDLPPGWSMVLDERMGTAAPAVTGRGIFYRQERQPVRATIGARDVTELLRDADHRAALQGQRDSRFLGLLHDPQPLTLFFDEPLNGEGAMPVLVADGWVEYPYSSVVFAAWQADESYTPPTLEAQTADGVWHEVYPRFGYPAGMPRRMALPLADLPPQTTALRLSGNLEIYWDRMTIVFDETPPAHRHEVLEPVVARVAKTGFAHRSTLPQRRPSYDYATRSPFWDTRYLPGFYTELGPALPLVAAEDDALAIIGPGEELHAQFVAPPAPPSAGWSRHYVLETRGYAKDMDLYTRDGDGVGPLPAKFRDDAVRSARARELHEQFNTRFQAGH